MAKAKKNQSRNEAFEALKIEEEEHTEIIKIDEPDIDENRLKHAVYSEIVISGLSKNMMDKIFQQCVNHLKSGGICSDVVSRVLRRYRQEM
jgi:hypothetical protein